MILKATSFNPNNPLEPKPPPGPLASSPPCQGGEHKQLLTCPRQGRSKAGEVPRRHTPCGCKGYVGMGLILWDNLG